MGDNIGQELTNLSESEQPSMSVVGAIEDILQGLYHEVGKDMAMKGNVVDVEDFVTLFKTQISDLKANSVIAKLGFEYSFRFEASGFARGIWLLWNKGSVVDKLDQVASEVKEPWMIAGDFNVIMCGEEIQGDFEPSLVGCNRFRSFVSQTQTSRFMISRTNVHAE
ncbi:hypothetical protein Goarm_002148 [Gossypium armourianum]|uniref:Uncharacterized protein n=1 Tax=Gossypium armourianum TaxID=34283 RepID=A0A7J9K779_9ROSI|nr:hypothetical protein [Gossypium armourianum]